MRDNEMTIAIDSRRFPREQWTGKTKPFERPDPELLHNAEKWVHSLIPGHDKKYCAEMIGNFPAPVAVLIGNILESTGCQRLTTVVPSASVLVIWDYTGGEN